MIISMLLPGFSWGVMNSCLFTPEAALAADQRKDSIKAQLDQQMRFCGYLQEHEEHKGSYITTRVISH